MNPNNRDQPGDVLTPEELQSWLAQEIKDSAKAHELRVKDATKFVEEYRGGKISGEEVMERLHAYDRRWGEALSGASASEGLTDEMILNAIDRARRTGLRTGGLKR
jgi:hypothetical protein